MEGRLPFCHLSFVIYHLAKRISCLVEQGDAVGGIVAYGIDDRSIDGGVFDVAMPEEF